MIPEIDIHEARRRLSTPDRPAYLDVRTPEEFAEGHVPGAINVPLLFLSPATGRPTSNPAFLEEVGRRLTPDQEIICGCKSGGRSAMAVELLQQAGYRHIVNMLGGFHGQPGGVGSPPVQGWATCGFPLCTHGAAGCQGYSPAPA